MNARDKAIAGFNYQSGQEQILSRSEWSTIMAAQLAAGGSRRVENGETFIHSAKGRIEFEVYANIAQPSTTNTETSDGQA